ncbi:unnamed protein product [Bursaphelenchus okinawaensis]|uniref:Cathepsin propeptide inhibitor domain-containing protein n=1 Tax=Bursaphelenchus okinawaensis TaxID=465554 RepID=A0A811L8G9_9BILA|nr:unnamed protein product [Bursaphelenchus okinawaensis]CAG9118937.1 unnamed protein product [Bursaphelenchus okinawaensis]
MKGIVLLCLCVVVVSSAEPEIKKACLKEDSELLKHFENKLEGEKDKEAFKKLVKFIKDFHKCYVDEEELKSRFEAFKSSLDKAEELHKKNPKASVDVTQYSDLSKDELKHLKKNGHLGKPIPAHEQREKHEKH